ncbi:MAG: hypothetical protein AB8E82_01255 [Aureispira sp.]
MELKDLAGHSTALAPALGMNPAQLNLMLEFLGKKKIAKPDVEFKASIANMAKPGKKPFLFVEEEKGSFFFYNLAFPMLKKDVEPKLKKAEKTLKTAKEGEKELLEAQVTFLSLLLDRIKKKKWLATSGKIAYKRTSSETNECFMSLEGKVEGPRKSSLHTVLADLDFKDKNGNILRVLGGSEEEVVSTKGTNEDTTGNNQVEDNSQSEQEKAKRKARRDKMEKGLNDMEPLVGKAPKAKLEAQIQKYEDFLVKMKEEANADGQIDEIEAIEIADMEQKIQDLKNNVNENGTTLTEERRAKVSQNVDTLAAKVAEIVASINV